MPRVDLDDVEWNDFALVTHNGEPFTGEVVEKTSTGAVVAVTDYTGGMEEGPSTEWYPSGVHQEWHLDGHLAAETEFDDQGRQLSNREWDETGNEVAVPDYRR